MKKYCSLLLCLLACRLAYADETPETLELPNVEIKMVDPLSEVWQRFEHAVKDNVPLVATVELCRFFMKRIEQLEARRDEQDKKIVILQSANDQQQRQINEQKQGYDLLKTDHEAQLNEQKSVSDLLQAKCDAVQRAHDALLQRYTEDSTQNASILKSVQQAFMKDNRFSGG